MSSKGIPKAVVLFCLIGVSVAPPGYAQSGARWDGWYVGANQGQGRASIAGVELTTGRNPIGSTTAKGSALGVQFGYDRQIAEWVLGAGALLNRAEITGSHQYIGGSSPANRVTYDIDRFSTVTGRLGYLLKAHTLVYLSAGLAWTRTDHIDDDPAGPFLGNSELTRRGRILGVGVEYRVYENVSAFIEYDSMDFGADRTDIRYNDGSVFAFSFDQELTFIGLGVNYRF